MVCHYGVVYENEIGIRSGRKAIMITGTRKALIVFLSVLVMILSAGCAEADQSKPDIEAENPYMTEAISEALDGIHNGHGGPFGCVIVKDDEIIGRGHNMVLKNNDSTAHGEIIAIRNAEQALKSYDLSGCTLYTTGEPCPMCLYAILWANIDTVYYGCTIEDNAEIGFRDQDFDALAGGREELSGYMTCIDREACLELFEEYKQSEHTVY